MWNDGWWAPWMMLAWLVFVGLVVAGIVLLVRGAGSRDATQERPNRPDARRILDERFARGEIDEEEYRRRRRVLDEG